MSVPHRTLVTGATGFVGAAVASQLVRAGHNVRVLHRPHADLRNLDGLDAERVIGDLNQSDSLQRAVDGCEAVFHVAADYRIWAPRPQELYRTNVQGTQSLLEAAERAGVKRMVYTSSVATLKVFENGRVSDEQTPVAEADIVGHYKRSKFLAEQLVSNFASSSNMECVIVNPSTPVGPGDIKPTPTGKVVRDAALGRIPAYVDTGLNIVHVNDVAAGHLLAFELGQPGRRYVLGGEDMTLKRLLTVVAECAGRVPPRVRLSRHIVWPLACAVEAWAQVTRSSGEPLLTRDGLRMARYRMYFSSARAMSELGYRPGDARKALADAVAWFAGRSFD